MTLLLWYNISVDVGFSKAKLNCAAIIDENIHHQRYTLLTKLSGCRDRPMSAMQVHNRYRPIHPQRDVSLYRTVWLLDSLNNCRSLGL
jgi:hypothetical protein